MIRRPTVPLLLSIVRQRLADVPDLPPAEQREVLTLADGILGICQRRTEHEHGWLLEEVLQVEELVTHLIMLGLDRGGTLRASYADLPPARELAAAELPERYDVASAMLAEAIPLAMGADAEVRERLHAVLDTRIAHERDIRGDVRLVRD